MAAVQQPGDPNRRPDVADTARRAREQLHEEIRQVRVGLEEMHAAEAGTQSMFGESFGEKARGTTMAMVGLIAAVCLTLALQQSRSVLTGSVSPLGSDASDSTRQGFASLGVGQAQAV